MAFKDMTVHLDSGERTEGRLAVATQLARKHQARLIGLFGQRARAQHVGVVAAWPSREYREAASASKAAFEKATAELPGAEWRDLNRGSDAELIRFAIEAARYTDLMVLGQHAEDRSAHVPATLAEEVVLESGRPVLVVPYTGEYPQIGQRPVIVWDGTRESARAMADAVPMMRGSTEAILISLMTGREEGATSCADVARHLGYHLTKVRIDVLTADYRHVFDFLMSRVTELGADLIVIGAHRAGSMWGANGISARDVLRQMVVPALLSS